MGEMKIVKYDRFGHEIYGFEEMKGRNREHCMCYYCHQFHPKEETNCPIAQGLYDYDRQHNVTTPVFECGEFVAPS